MGRFFIDANVARSVGQALADAQHDVIYTTQALPEGSPDTVVCSAALANDCILVAHDRDMKAMSQQPRFERLGFLMLYCNEVMAAKRVQHLQSLIDHELAACDQKPARRFFVEIHNHAIRIHR